MSKKVLRRTIRQLLSLSITANWLYLRIKQKKWPSANLNENLKLKKTFGTAMMVSLFWGHWTKS